MRKPTNRAPEAGFEFRHWVLHAGAVNLAETADRFGTPCYVYARDRIESAYRSYDAAFGKRRHLVCYAVKANPSNAILEMLADAGAGFDIVSVGELARVLRAGGDPARVVFSGVGKRDDELSAALETGIHSFNVESPSELHSLDRLARQLNVVAPVTLRVNPDIDAITHPHIATGGQRHKFGIAQEQIPGLAAQTRRLPGIDLRGLAMHIGSQIMDLTPLTEAAGRLYQLAAGLREAGFKLRHLDFGGGLGVGLGAPAPAAYVTELNRVVGDNDYEILVEPGRSIVADAGLLLTRVLFIKHNHAKSFAIVDAGMNDLLRPALYNAHHDIVVVATGDRPPRASYDIVGPVCESADTLGARRNLAIREGSLLAVMQAGAYGATMSSHYNSRPRCPEVFIEAGGMRLSRARETLDDLTRHEQ